MMLGAKPLKIFLKEGAEPVSVHWPAVIPAHWVSQVREEIKWDIALGVLKRMPYNTRCRAAPGCTLWPKSWGTHGGWWTKRQTTYVEPPFSQASGVPAGTVRFTSDAWIGYHSILLD